MEFNKAQKKAIAHTTGPMLVLAGPGSGKTTVITERIRTMITDQGIDPSHILVVTFTKAAAAEMKERFFYRMGKKKYPVTFGTFHAVFFQVLKYAYGFHGGNIIREEQRFQLMGEIIRSMHMEYEDEKELIGDLLGEISLVKNTGVSLKHYYSKSCGQEIFQEIYQKYENKMKQQRLIDFDDMLVYCYELFDQRKDILAGWQRKFQYILIDEFQDINQIQFEIVKMLALPENNLFVVGDDDQSIYRFRGAKPELMLGFETSYPETERVLLDTNYRSRPEVVQTSLCLISHNKKRFEKKVRSFSQNSEKADSARDEDSRRRVNYFLWESQQEEGRAIVDCILKGCSQGRRYQDFAVLFRTNTQPRMLMSQLMAYNIPFRTRDNIPNLYEHWIARDILTYIRLAMGSRMRRDLLMIMNRPNRYITRDSLEEETVAFDVWAEYFYEKKQHWVAERIEQLEADLRVLSRIKPYGAVNYIRMGMGYEEFLHSYAEYRRINGEELIQVLDELHEDARAFATYEEWFAHMEEYTKELQRQRKEQNLLTDCVSLATFHSAKGLEYPVVHILDANEELMPYKKAMLDADIEEERRIFYVGITRAKESLHVHSVKKYHGREIDVSRFVEEMQKEAEGSCF
ncbi:MAG: ATP-dependent helicase [Lachnospiraceae bacterium]|nr:ATP-dependent helicase [Lachnospiraceae bacterium]